MNPARRVSIVAHRGASARAQENTRPAFEAAIQIGADCIETDIRRTADGVLVLHHDAAAFGQPLLNCRFSELLDEFRVHNAELTTFDELLSLARNRIGLDIEFKEAGYEGEVLQHLRHADVPPEAFVITSFMDDARLAVKAIQPDIRCGLLVENDRNSVSPFDPSALFTRLQETCADFIAAEASLLSQSLSQQLFKYNYPIWAWTVDNPEMMKHLLKVPGVCSLITNRPDIALEIRAKLAPGMG